MKRLFRYISLCLIVAMLLAVPALSAEPRASDFIMSTCVYLDKTSSTQFDVWHEIIARDIMDELGTCEIQIQESTDGTNWTTVKTFTPEEESSMVTYNNYAYANHVSYTGVPGRYYRARLIMFAENSNGRGEVTTYTETLKL